MKFEVCKYQATRDYRPLTELIQSEGEEWAHYLKPEYEQALEKSITYVAIADDKLCGYSRSMQDHGLFIWVIDLLVHEKYRGYEIGRKLMECLLDEYPDLEILVMSDVDGYYEKLGYEREGSIFKVERGS